MANKTATVSKGLLQLVTDLCKVIMEKGIIPWRKTWQSSGRGGPVRENGKDYRGVNRYLLAMQGAMCGFISQMWIGKKTALKQGAIEVNGPGSVIFCPSGWITTKDATTGEETRRPTKWIARKVWNVESIVWTAGSEGSLKLEEETTVVPVAEADLAAHPLMRKVLNHYFDVPTAPRLAHGGNQAYYSPPKDHVQVPNEGDFDGPSAYLVTLAHEVAHSTGHKDRLARKGITDSDGFGKDQYAFEELVAEFTSCELAMRTGITDTRENTKAYLLCWVSRLENNPEWLGKAAAAAQVSADYIMKGFEE